ncbi:MAG: DoxX [Candidatus Parcubacteria bacterium]|jgi:putative oxidoreductase
MNNTKNTILLIIRLAVGLMVIWTGYMKLSGMEMTTGFFATMGLSAGIAWTVSIAEVLIGLALVFGVWVRLASLGLLIIMVGVFHYAGHYNWQTISLFIGSILLALLGAGAYSVCKNTRKMAMTAAPVTPTSSVPPSNPQM